MKNSKLKKKPKTQAKNSKLKQKPQGPGGTRLFPLPKWCKKSLSYPSLWENSVCSTDSALPQIMLVCSTPSLSLLYSKTKYDSALQKFDSALQKNWAVEQNQTTIEQNQTAVEQNQTTVEQNQTTIEQNQACFFNS